MAETKHRVSRHNGRAGKHGVYNPKHNDRQFDVAHAENIKQDRTSLNLYWDWQGIFLWAFEGLKRLVANKFRFTESLRIKANREFVRQDGNSMISFMESEGYIRLDPALSISSQELYSIYCIYCKENGLVPLKPRSMSEFLIANKKKFGIEDNNNQTNAAGRRVRGFSGIGAILKLPMETVDHWQKAWPDDNPFDNKRTIPG